VIHPQSAEGGVVPSRVVITRSPSGLFVDEAKVLTAMADEAIAILHEAGRLPSKSGEFADSIQAELVDGAAVVAPTGARNETIARVFKKRGIDLFAFDSREQTRIVRAAQEEIDRQIRSKEMGLQ
jgi:hypothetical protein